ncbi:hypothetical protein [Nocardioides sp.]|jgi:hypothetical protein|uniref:hypothetical protein n=1 Tax=Nocardioides sp. TaxID=35761 RepID=UPI002F423985
MSSRWRHWPAAVAATYCILVIGGLVIAPAPPAIDSTPMGVSNYYRGESDSIRTVVWLIAVSLLPLAVLMSTVRERLAGIGRDVFLLGVASFMAATTIELWFDAGLSAHAGTTPPDTLTVLAGIAAYFTPTLTVADLLMAVPVAMAALRIRIFPRWYGYLSIAFAIEQAVETLTITGRHGFAAAGGTMNYTLGAGLFLIWVAATGFACTSAPPLSARVSSPGSRIEAGPLS